MQRRAPAHMAHDQHVGVVPVARPGERSPAVLVEANLRDAVLPVGRDFLPAVPDVSRCSPAIGQPREIGGMLEGGGIRQAEDDVAAAGPQGLTHLRDMWYVDRAPVVFEVVEPPRGPLLDIVFSE